MALILVILVAGTGLSAALLWRSASNAAPPLLNGTMLSPRRELPDFNLIDHQGRNFTRANLRGGWSLLYFGYTNCPDVCPATLATLAAMDKKMRAAADEPRPRVIFVSVDAARDTPAQLARYVPYFDADFVGVTANDQPTIEALARKLGIVILISHRRDGTYSVDHSSAILAVDPAGRIAAILSGPFEAAALQSDVRSIMAGPS